jgi:histidyl-tRNA synthetase
VLETAGYQEIRLPLFERTELFTRGIGETTDIVQKEMYTFEDRSGESLTLRPEGTASVIRAYLEHGMAVWPKPVRLYYLGPMFRHERPQAGRHRQFYQIGAEVLGADSPVVDAEVIAVLIELFRNLGLAQRLELLLNSIGDARCRPAYRDQLAGYLRLHLQDLCDDCKERVERNPLRVLDCKKLGCAPVIREAPEITQHLCHDCRQHFDCVQEYLGTLGVSFTLAPRLVRGLDYYTRTTFELVSRELGAQNAVAAGGRYDGLVEELDGPPTPGIGFAMGVERIALLLPDQESPHAFRLLLVPLGAEALRQLLPVWLALHRQGVHVEIASGERKLKAELERANRLKASHVVIVGENELKAKSALLRDMVTGNQRQLALDHLQDQLLEELNGAVKKR